MKIGDTPFQLLFNIDSGKCSERESSKRYLSDVKGIFYDAAEAERRLAVDDQLI